jgi:hypothetical protein
MADFTRRGFLTQMSVVTGVGIAGGLGLHQLLGSRGTDAAVASSLSGRASSTSSSSLPTLSAPDLSLSSRSLAGPMVVHVRDVASAEISLMVGTHEVVVHDRDLAARLARAAHGKKG